MHKEELIALARQDRLRAVDHMYRQLLWRRIHEIMEQVDPPAEPDEQVGAVLERAKAAGDEDAARVISEEGRDALRQDASALVDQLVAKSDDNALTV